MVIKMLCLHALFYYVAGKQKQYKFNFIEAGVSLYIVLPEIKYYKFPVKLVYNKV